MLANILPNVESNSNLDAPIMTRMKDLGPRQSNIATERNDI
jgi:hypothetical protein